MSLIVDASVAVKWVSDERDSLTARALYLEETDWIAPSLVLAEVGNALWNKCRRGLVREGQVHDAMLMLPMFLAGIFEVEEFAPRAAQLALRLDHPIYDCFYLALAEREAAPIVSADRKLLAAAARLGSIEARPL